MATYKVVRADLRTDRAKLVDLLVRNEPEMPRQADQLAWHLERNPHGEGRAWLLLAEPGGKPIGMTGLVMRRMKANGEVVLGGRTWGVSVDKEHRTLGPAIMLARAALEELDNDLAFLFVLPYSKTAGTLFGRAGYKKVAFLDRYVRVLRSKHYLQNAARHQIVHNRLLRHPLVQRSLAGPVAELLGPPADLATHLTFDRPWQRPRDLALHCVSGFDERFDALWERARSRHAFTSERTADFLGWRYRRAWDTHFTLGLSLPGDEQRLSGYAVLTFDQRQAIVVDLLVEDPVAMLPGALFLVIDWVRRHGFQSISMAYAGAPGLGEALRRRWFINTTTHDQPKQRRSPPSAPAEESPSDELMIAAARNRPALPPLEAWYFTVGDDV